MKYQRFEDLPVWKASIDLAHQVYALTRERYFGQPGDLRDQLRRAALSVSNNIAEGFERGSTNELLMFLYIARGSAGEVRSMLHFVAAEPDAEYLHSRITELTSVAESCSRQLRAWADQLQNSEIRGQRHLNDAVRDESAARRRAGALQQRLDELLRESRPSPNSQQRDDDAESEA